MSQVIIRMKGTDKSSDKSNLTELWCGTTGHKPITYFVKYIHVNVLMTMVMMSKLIL